VCVCVCARERKRERERKSTSAREKEQGRDYLNNGSEGGGKISQHCGEEREREGIKISGSRIRDFREQTLGFNHSATGARYQI